MNNSNGRSEKLHAFVEDQLVPCKDNTYYGYASSMKPDLSPYNIQMNRWIALQAVADRRGINFFCDLRVARMNPEDVTLAELTLVCNTLHDILSLDDKE